MAGEALRMDRVTYMEHDVTLLDNFNFQIFEGEVMGLMPLDSLGLDALLQLLLENRPILYGYIYLKEELVNTYSTDVHTENNVLLISNENNLVDYLTAAENVFILRRGYKGILVKSAMLRSQLQILLSELGMDIPADRPLKELSLFERYVLEIVRAVVSKTDLIILQDPSSAVNPDDLERLYKVIRYYAGQGNTFLYISIHQEELVQICNRVSLMANGRIVKVTEQLTDTLLSHYAVSHHSPIHDSNTSEDGVERVFRCRNVYYNKIQGLSFSVRRGECLVFHDYENQICNDLVNIVVGCKPEKGEVLCRERKYGKRNRRRMAVILEDPADTMLFDDMSYEDNLCMTLDHRLRRMWPSSRVRKSIAREIMGEKLPDPRQRVRDLSIRQKYQLIYTRILLQRPDVVFCIHPFLNVDMELREYIESLILKFIEQQIAVVIIALNFQDALSLADRLLLVKNGKNIGILTRDEFEHLIVFGQ